MSDSDKATAAILLAALAAIIWIIISSYQAAHRVCYDEYSRPESCYVPSGQVYEPENYGR